ncbi:MAG: hypothetical protein RL219_2016, partial [Actinomycetota bacterium]
LLEQSDPDHASMQVPLYLGSDVHGSTVMGRHRNVPIGVT